MKVKLWLVVLVKRLENRLFDSLQNSLCRETHICHRNSLHTSLFTGGLWIASSAMGSRLSCGVARAHRELRSFTCTGFLPTPISGPGSCLSRFVRLAAAP